MIINRSIQPDFKQQATEKQLGSAEELIEVSLLRCLAVFFRHYDTIL